MMEVDVSRTDRFSPANVLRCAAHVAPLRAQERAGAGEQAPTILGVVAQVALDQRRGFTVLAEMQQRPGDVIVPKGRVLVRWDLSKDAQGVLVFPLMDEGDPDALLSEQVGGVQGQSLLEFGDRVVEEADVVVNNAELRSEEHTSELQSRLHLVCRLLLEKKKTTRILIVASNR